MYMYILLGMATLTIAKVWIAYIYEDIRFIFCKYLSIISCIQPSITGFTFQPIILTSLDREARSVLNGPRKIKMPITAIAHASLWNRLLICNTKPMWINCEQIVKEITRMWGRHTMTHLYKQYGN